MPSRVNAYVFTRVLAAARYTMLKGNVLGAGELIKTSAQVRNAS